MNDKPVWRRAYDAVDSTVAPRVEALVHTSQFANTTAVFARARRRVGDQVNGFAARVWHLFNLPARTDIQRLHTQVGAVDTPSASQTNWVCLRNRAAKGARDDNPRTLSHR
jgi:hypothetical protein